MNTQTKILLGTAGAAATVGLVWWAATALKKVAANKSDRKSFSSESPETKAKLIRMAFENDGQFGTDVPALRLIMRSLKNQEEYNAIAKQYELQNRAKGLSISRTLNNDMKTELQTSEFKEMLAIKEGKPLRAGDKILKSTVYRQWANRLKAAFEKQYSFMPGTDEGAIHAVFVEIPTQKDFTNTSAFYTVQFGTDLIKDLQAELEVWEYPQFMKLITSKAKG